MTAVVQQLAVSTPSQPTRSSVAHQTASDSFFTCNPTHRVVFRTALGKHSTQTLTISNNSAETLIYKVKTNEHRIYAVTAGCDYIQPHASVEVQLIQRAVHRYPNAHDVARHRFLVVAAPLSAARYRDFGEPVHASVLWLQIRDEDVRKRTLGVIVKQSAFYIPLQHLVMYRPSALTFTSSQQPDGAHRAHVDVTNISDVSVLFKLKCTNHDAYVVQPRQGVLEPQQTSRIQLRTLAASSHGHSDDHHQHDVISAATTSCDTDRFRLEIAAIQDENVLLRMSAAQLWPRIMGGDISTAMLNVSKRIQERAFEAPGTVERNFRNLRFTLKSRASSMAKARPKAACFAHAVEDVLVCTPHVLRVGVQSEHNQQRSILRVSNISEHCLLYRFKSANMGLYEVQPATQIIAAYDSLTVSVRVQNMRVMCDDWARLYDEASVEVSAVDLSAEQSCNSNEQQLRELWHATDDKDVLRATVAVHIRP